MKRVIAIDGPSGAGKSTLSRLLAEALGFEYLDTGALYRAAALNLLRFGLDERASDDEIRTALEKTRITFSGGNVLLNGADVSGEIRTPTASHYASVFSARRPVRQYLLQAQRDASTQSDLVAEGRDMTTIVFPDAYRKIYLDASVEERTKRRTAELLASGLEVDEDQICRKIIERDSRDSGRELAPLTKSKDAFYVDSTGLSKAEVLRTVMEFIGEIT